MALVLLTAALWTAGVRWGSPPTPRSIHVLTIAPRAPAFRDPRSESAQNRPIPTTTYAITTQPTRGSHAHTTRASPVLSTLFPGLNPPTPQPPTSHDCIGVVLDKGDARVREHPGGTEEQALVERRTLARENWPVRPAAVWRTRSRPEVSANLSCVQAVATSNQRSKSRCRDDDFRCRWMTLASAEDHRGGAACASVYGYDVLSRFEQGSVDMCDQGRSSVSCFQHRMHSSHTIDTSICAASNAGVSFDSIGDGDFPWLAFQSGAFQAQCTVTDLSRNRWNFMHCLQDWMGLGFSAVRKLQCDVTIDTPTVFVTRSGDYSPFALAHDWVNTVLLYAARNLSARDVQVVVMDRMTVGFYMPVWQRLFSPTRELQWFVDLRKQHQGKRVCYSQAHFNVPARLSPLYNEDECIGSSWIRLTADLVAEAVGGGQTVPKADAIVVTVIIRKNYGTGHPIGRRIRNTGALVEMLRQIPRVIVSAIDFAEFDFDQQVNISKSTDVLVGMHGAGLIQSMFLPQHAGLLEFFCPDRPSSNIRYRELSKRLGIVYKSFSLGDDYVVPQKAKSLVSELVAEVWKRKVVAP